jgi:ABC-type hemin transport system ATPase subunit
MTVEISALAKHYGGEAALSGVNLDVAHGEFLALLGPPGAGKTTLLRLIAGLDQPDAGSVLIDGNDVRTLSARDRRIGFVFQNYALFRHMSVARTIAFGLRVKPRRERPSREKIAARVEELLHLMRAFRARPPLSGSAFRRAAAARRPCPCARDRSEGIAPRRAVRCARCQGSQRVACMVARITENATAYLNFCHPRSARGVPTRRPDRYPACWSDCAGG